MADKNSQEQEKKFHPSWYASEKYQGSIIINDPAWR